MIVHAFLSQFVSLYEVLFRGDIIPNAGSWSSSFILSLHWLLNWSDSVYAMLFSEGHTLPLRDSAMLSAWLGFAFLWLVIDLSLIDIFKFNCILSWFCYSVNWQWLLSSWRNPFGWGCCLRTMNTMQLLSWLHTIRHLGFLGWWSRSLCLKDKLDGLKFWQPSGLPLQLESFTGFDSWWSIAFSVGLSW